MTLASFGSLTVIFLLNPLEIKSISSGSNLNKLLFFITKSALTQDQIDKLVEQANNQANNQANKANNQANNQKNNKKDKNDQQSKTTTLAPFNQTVVDRVVNWIGNEMTVYNTPYCWRRMLRFLFAQTLFMYSFTIRFSKI
jgi:alpha-N-acetylglucosamine transferase